MSRVAMSVCALAASALVAVAAIAPPLDRLADRSFAWHMLQHLVIFYLATLLLILARPFDLYVRVAGKRATAALVRATRPLHVVAAAPVALAVLLATLWGTHFSPLYEASLEHPWIHATEHALYFAAGVIFWLPVLAPPPLRPGSYPARLLYLVVALPQGSLLGMAIESARRPIYSHYNAAAGSLAGALLDQRNAAAVMWIGAGLVVFIALLATLAAWARRESAEPRPEAIAPFAARSR